MPQLKQDEWPADREPTTANEQIGRDPKESPSPESSVAREGERLEEAGACDPDGEPIFPVP